MKRRIAINGDEPNWKRWKRPRLSKWENPPIEVRHVLHVNLKPMTPKSFLNENDYDLIHRYAKKMQFGIRFPLIEVEKMRNGKYFISDGNTRFRAWCSLDHKKIPVMVFKT